MPGLLWTLVGVDKASPAFARVAGAADRTAASTLRAQKNTEGAVAGMNRAGAKLTKGLTAPLLGLGAVSVAQAAKFQKATSVYVTAAGESAKNLGVVRDGIKRTAAETGESTGQLTAAQYLLEKANIRGAASQKLLNAATKGSIEENANLADVVQGATSVMASYHLSTDRSVQVINALKTGAGSAKTTMEEYVKSLSTVIPVASAAGVSLDQTLGAISTLTQHGTSAQEATQELAFAIRNLQAPNNVAVSAMNQLGISSVDVSKNLGKRGLTGTLEYIESKLPKTGLVYLSTMKQMEAGTADLNAMTSKMTPSLAKLSKGLLDGSVSAKDYRADFRDLGATGYAQGSQFLTLATRVKGYNDSLKAGTPAQKTMAAELKAIFGGAVGLNTALQLGGTNLAGFNERTEAVGKSLNNTSKDVEGWKRTSQLASVQADRFKETMRVLAINLGAAALPALTSLAQKATGVVSSFQHLSGTQKSLLTWGAGIAIGLGPVLSIGGKLANLGSGIARFSTATASRLGGLAGSVEATSGRISLGMSRVGSAVGGAAIGFAVGSLTKNSGKGVKALGALASAAAGAAIGFGAAGPWGAAIGAGAGLLGSLAGGFKGAGNAAKNNVSGIDSFTDAIKRDNLALGQNVKALIATDLNKKYGGTGKTTFSLAQKLGIDPKTLTDAVAGVQSAKAKVDAILSANSGDSLGVRVGRGVAKANAAAASILGVNVGSTLTGKQVATLRQYAGAANDVASAIGAETTQAKAGQKAARNYDAATSTAGKNDTARAKALKSITEQQAAAAASLRTLTQQVAVHGTSLDPSKGDGQSNITMLDSLIGRYKTIEQAQVLAGVAASKAAGGFEASTDALRAQAVQAGLSGKSVDGLIAKYELTPKQIVTYMLANIGKATASADQLQTVLDSVRQNKIPGLNANSKQGLAAAAALQARINQLHGVTISVDADINGARSKILSLVNGYYRATVVVDSNGIRRATGGTVRGRGTATSDSVPIMASNGEEVINAKQSAKHRPLLKAINAGMAGFATGGTVGLAARFARGGTVGNKQSLMAAIEAAGFKGRAAEIMYAIVMAESGGNARAHNGNAGTGDNSYGLAQINMLGSMGPARRKQYGLSSNSQLFDPATNLAIAYKMSHGGTKFSDWSTYNRGDYEKFLGQSGAKIKNGGKGGGSLMGPDGQTYASARAASNALIRAQNTLAKELPRFSKAVGGTTDQLKSAETALLNDVKAVGASSKTLTKIQKDFGRLNTLAAKRDSLQAQLGSPTKDTTTAYDQLASDQQAFADQVKSVKDAISSGFSILTSGGSVDTTSVSSGPSPAFQAAMARYQAGRQQVGDAAILGAGDGTDSGSGTPAYSIGGNLSSLDTQIAAARKFKARLAKLEKEGLDTSLYGQLAGEGVAGAGPQVDVLASASAAQIKALSSKYATLVGIGGATGTDVAKVVDGAAVTRDEGVIRTLQTELAADRAAMAAQTRAIVDAIHGIGGDLGDTLNGAAGKAKNKARGIRAGHSGAFG